MDLSRQVTFHDPQYFFVCCLTLLTVIPYRIALLPTDRNLMSVDVSAEEWDNPVRELSN